MAAPKIIVLGSLDGQLESAFKKLATLHAKNSFSFAILVGDVFSEDEEDVAAAALLDGSLTVPLPTYFTVGNRPLPPRIAAKVGNAEDVCPNLFFISNHSVLRTSEGVRIVNLAGPTDSNLDGPSSQSHLPVHSNVDAKALRGANSADILLTTIWPANVQKRSRQNLEPAQLSSLQSSDAVADLSAALKPRYHFAMSPGAFFFEREPFIQVNEKDSDAVNVTRFISMAPYGNEAKAKAMYAFTLNSTDTAVPTGATASPFLSKQQPQKTNDGSFSRFGKHHRGDEGHHGRGSKRRRHSPPLGPDRCYFCLSNPNISAHMCCSIGNDAYITTAKGPLTTATTFKEQGLTFPGHFIIIPLPHAPTITAMGSVADSQGDACKVYAEMARFRESIQATITSLSSHRLGVITWEISRERNVHLIWQTIAFPAETIQKGLAETAFKVEAENSDYPKFKSQDLNLEQQATYGDFFRVWFWADNGQDKIHGQSLVMPLASDQRFDLQFPRRVLAKLLGLEKRVVWQDCAQTEEEETNDVAAFREAFKDWDFTLES